MAFFVILVTGLIWATIAVVRQGSRGLTWIMLLVTLLGLAGTVNWIMGRL